MSKFFNTKYKLDPYDTMGDKSPSPDSVRLNTNECPYPPSPLAIKYASEASKSLNFYSDPECNILSEKAAKFYGIEKNEILFGNGSDEILNFIFMSFCQNGAVFPDITYSFYKTLAEMNNVDYKLIKLKNFKIIPEDYFETGMTVFIANPNAPTGISLDLNEIKKILENNKNNIIVIDEAYIDFALETKSCINLIHEYDNLLVTRTFSKSRSLAGARLGFCVGCGEIIKDLRNVKNSIVPYNINAMTQAAGIGSLEDENYMLKNIKLIRDTRDFVKKELENLEFEILNSETNFLFAKHKKMNGEKIYLELQKKNILIRHFSNPLISQYNRITIGTFEQMKIMLDALKGILKNA